MANRYRTLHKHQQQGIKELLRALDDQDYLYKSKRLQKSR